MHKPILKLEHLYHNSAVSTHKLDIFLQNEYDSTHRNF